MRNRRYVAYYRVSTVKQGHSVLGLEAQREAVARCLNGEGLEVIAEFTEVEVEGARTDRSWRKPLRPRDSTGVHWWSPRSTVSQGP
jgi:DNA invertase Pin-like site-specific DNA recombinase